MSFGNSPIQTTPQKCLPPLRNSNQPLKQKSQPHRWESELSEQKDALQISRCSKRATLWQKEMGF